MSEKFSLAELEPIMLEVLDSGNEFVMKTHGISMMPMLSDGSDEAVLIKPTGKLNKYDIALFKRRDGQFVLHRVVGENSQGYIFRGDNQIINEHGVTDNMIIAVMTAYVKNGRRIEITDAEYKRYLKTLKPRYTKKRIRQLLSRAYRSIFPKKAP